MSGLNIHYFAHSWVSDWNHGNAHFLRGLARELMKLGHKVKCYEQLGGWSLSNLVNVEGERAVDSIDGFRRAYPLLDIHFYNNDETLPEFLAEELEGADIVIIHEWNEPVVANTILSLKDKIGFRSLFHDTHHRAYSSPRDILRFRLDLFDGVLAFGEAIRRIYCDGFGIERAWTFHEAADIDHFRPASLDKQQHVVWIGNWGDEERTKELHEFLIGPAAAEPKRRTVVHGVRYPEHAIKMLIDAGIEYRGYVPNLRSPEVYGRSFAAVHVPRQQYANGLTGVPTIRVFEALACGVPLLCAPWKDAEALFRPGQDYLVVQNGAEMKGVIETMITDPSARRQLAKAGLESVRSRHTCAHRAQELSEIFMELGR